MSESAIKSSGNVFVDLGYSPDEAAILQMRADLMANIRKFTPICDPASPTPSGSFWEIRVSFKSSINCFVFLSNLSIGLDTSRIDFCLTDTIFFIIC